MKIIIVEPDKQSYPKEIDNVVDINVLRDIVGGRIQMMKPFIDEVCIICNMDGIVQDLPRNRMIRYENDDIETFIAGTFIICGYNSDTGECCDLSPFCLNKYLNKYRYREREDRVEHIKFMSTVYPEKQAIYANVDDTKIVAVPYYNENDLSNMIRYIYHKEINGLMLKDRVDNFGKSIDSGESI